MAQNRLVPGRGQWLVVIRRVAMAGVAQLQTAYEQPNSRPATGACYADLWTLGLTLIDRAGVALDPAPPWGPCGPPQDALVHALARVRWREASVRLVRPSTDRFRGACPPEWGNEIQLATRSQLVPSAGGPLIVPAQGDIEYLCVYQSTGADPAIGRFQSVSIVRTDRLLPALTGPAPSGRCVPQRRFGVALIFTYLVSSDANIELGGCWRVLRPDDTIGAANPAVIHALVAAASR